MSYVCPVDVYSIAVPAAVGGRAATGVVTADTAVEVVVAGPEVAATAEGRVVTLLAAVGTEIAVAVVIATVV